MTFWERFLQRVEGILPNLIAAVIILAVGFLVRRLTLKIMAKGLNVKHVDPTIHKFSMSVVNVVIMVLVVVMALSAMNVPMSSIIAAISTAGLAIGLALKDSLSNVAGGVLILLSKPFKCGDYIRVGSEEGTVEMITMFYTKLLTIDNRGVFIPNSNVTGTTVINLTSERLRRLELKLSISYSDDIDLARRVILDTVAADPHILNAPDKPMAAVSEHGESAIVITMRAWVETKNYWAARFALLENIKKAFDANGLTIPFNQMDIHLNNMDNSDKTDRQ